MLALADMGAGGITLLALFLVALLAGLAGLALWLDYLLRPRGDHTRRAGLDVLSSPAPRPAQSMQWDQDEEWREARWEHEFRAWHPAAQVQAAFDQQGGWVSGFCDAPPPSPGGTWALPVPGPPATGPDEHGRGAFLSAAPPPVRPKPPEVAHDEYAGPAPAVVPPPAPAEWAGPVPPTPDDDALAAQVRAWCSEMDAGTLNYLHDYAAELRAA